MLHKQRCQNLCRPEGVASWPIWPSEHLMKVELEKEVQRLDEREWLLRVKSGPYGTHLQFPRSCWALSEANPSLQVDWQGINQIMKSLIEQVAENQGTMAMAVEAKGPR